VALFFYLPRGIAVPVLSATAASAALGSWLSTHFEEQSPLLRPALNAVLAIAPCDGGCALARTDLLHTILASALLAALIIPVVAAAAYSRRRANDHSRSGGGQ